MLTLPQSASRESNNGLSMEHLVLGDQAKPNEHITITAFHSDESRSLLDETPPVTAIVHPGHLCSRQHQDTRGVAETLATELDVTAITVDPRGTHDSYSEGGGEYDFDQLPTDLADLTRLLSPAEGVILGGHCLGGAYALAAAGLLERDSDGNTPRVICAFSDKTMAEGEDFAPLPFVKNRAQRGKPFPQQDPISGGLLLEGPRITIPEAKLDQYIRLGALSAHLESIPNTPVLLTASEEDQDIIYDKVRKLAEKFPNAHFLDVPGEHSDTRPEIAQGTGKIVARWILENGYI